MQKARVGSSYGMHILNSPACCSSCELMFAARALRRTSAGPWTIAKARAAAPPRASRAGDAGGGAAPGAKPVGGRHDHLVVAEAGDQQPYESERERRRRDPVGQ